jgi:hypothetical protein
MIRTLALAAIALALPAMAMADIGPKPTITLHLKAAPGVRITEGELLECEDAHCAAPTPLQRLGPQGFGCRADSCSGQAYGFSEYEQVALTLADGRHLTSAPFVKTQFNQTFDMKIRHGRLRVTPAG